MGGIKDGKMKCTALMGHHLATACGVIVIKSEGGKYSPSCCSDTAWSSIQESGGVGVAGQELLPFL